MAHILGAKLHIPHGRANAVLLPYVIRYNANKPTKFAAFPQYQYPKAHRRYAEIAEFVGRWQDSEESVDNLITQPSRAFEEVQIPLTLRMQVLMKETSIFSP